MTLEVFLHIKHKLLGTILEPGFHSEIFGVVNNSERHVTEVLINPSTEHHLIKKDIQGRKKNCY